MKLKEKKRSIDDLRIQRLLKYQEQTVSQINYSVQRFDLLIISISGAGIYLMFETLKFLKTPANHICSVNVILLKITGVLFMLAIIVNLISQLTGWHANSNEDKWINIEIKKKNKEEFDRHQYKSLNKKVSSLNCWTDILNYASAFLMFLGIALSIIFYWQNF